MLTCWAGFLQAQLVDNGDGTISDTGKGIMWTSNAKLPGSSSLTYTEALNWVNNLDYAGYTDWRLPAGTDPRSDASRTTPDDQYYYECIHSEFGDLFYVKLGGASGLPITHTRMKTLPYSTIDNNDPDLDKFTNVHSVLGTEMKSV